MVFLLFFRGNWSIRIYLAFELGFGGSLDKFSDFRIWTTVTMPLASLNLHVTVTSPSWNVKICEPYRVLRYTERGSFFNTSMIFAWGEKERVEKQIKIHCPGIQTFQSMDSIWQMLTLLIWNSSICWVARSLNTTSSVLSDKIQLGTLTALEAMPDAELGNMIVCWTFGWAFFDAVSSPSGSSRASNAWLSSSVDMDWCSMNENKNDRNISKYQRVHLCWEQPKILNSDLIL